MCERLNVIFNDIAVGENSLMKVFLSHTDRDSNTYRVKQKYEKYSLDNVFQIECIVEDGMVYALISFKPEIPNFSYIKHYTAWSPNEERKKINVKGRGLAPLFHLRETVLQFVISTEDTVTSDSSSTENCREKYLEITNESAVCGRYQWLLPNSGCRYYVFEEDGCGYLEAGIKLIVPVQFIATDPGYYKEEIILLIENQEPVVITLAGSVDTEPPEDVSVQCDCGSSSSYEHLMSNVLKYLITVPSASAAPSHLDFGKGSADDMFLNIPQSFWVTNHETVAGTIQWSVAAESIFQIQPPEAIIEPEDSCLFTVRFRPTQNDRAYGDILIGRFSVMVEGTLNKKCLKDTFLRMPCAGHTFNPLYDEPIKIQTVTKVALPPTVPKVTAYRNIPINNRSEEPLYFRFDPPTTSNIVVYPRCGVVPDNAFLFISIAFEPKTSGYFREDWDLALNNGEKIRVTFEATAEDSSVEIGSVGVHKDADAMLVFEPTTTGCSSFCYAVLHNVTRNIIGVRFETSATWLACELGNYVSLEPNEIVALRWWFYPTKDEKVYETCVNTSCITLHNGLPSGSAAEYIIFFTGYAEHPKLKVLPKDLNLQEIVVGDKVYFHILLYNYGTCELFFNLHYKLLEYGDKSTDIISMYSKPLRLKPHEVKYSAEGSVECKSIGWRQINIYYTVIYSNENDDTCYKVCGEKPICKVWFDGIYPMAQIKRVVAVDAPTMFSAHCLWNIMKIENLNKALERCSPNKTETVNLFAPKMHVGARKVSLILILDCTKNCNFVWQVKREKLCDCQLVTIKLGTSIYEGKYDCRHRPLVNMSPMGATLEPEHAVEIAITFEYNEPQENILAYRMSLSHERSIKLLFHVYAYDPRVGTLVSLRNYSEGEGAVVILNCGKVPINNLDCVHRYKPEIFKIRVKRHLSGARPRAASALVCSREVILWLYNPTLAKVSWRLLKSRRKHQQNIDCLICQAMVPPMSRFALPFSFLPTEMIDYEEVFVSLVNSKLTNIIVKGQGGLPSCVETRLDMPSYIQRRILREHCDGHIYLSDEHVTIAPISVNARVDKTIQVVNDTNHTMKVSWMTEKVGNMIRIAIQPRVYDLPPKSEHSFTIVIRLLQEAVTFTISVACACLDLTLLDRYNCNQLWKQMANDICEQEFTITEEGCKHCDPKDMTPAVLQLDPPLANSLVMSLSIQSVGQRDSYHRFCSSQLVGWKDDNLLANFARARRIGESHNERRNMRNIISTNDVLRFVENILWTALNSKLMKHTIQSYSEEQIQSYNPFHEEIQGVDYEDYKSVEKVERLKIAWSIANYIVAKAIYKTAGRQDDCEFDCFCPIYSETATIS